MDASEAFFPEVTGHPSPFALEFTPALRREYFLYRTNVLLLHSLARRLSYAVRQKIHFFKTAARNPSLKRSGAVHVHVQANGRAPPVTYAGITSVMVWLL